MQTEIDSSSWLVDVARYQNQILGTILILWLGGAIANVFVSAVISAFDGLHVLEYPVAGVFLLGYVYISYLVYKLAGKLRYKRPVYWLISMILLAPLHLFILLYINRKAVQKLREAGVDVGLMGANIQEVKRTVKT